jgi:hypothetical protein
MAELRRGFNVFSFQDEIQINRIGKKVQVKGRDGTFQETDSVEANLLYEILKQLKKK